MIVLDTSAIIDLLDGNEQGRKIAEVLGTETAAASAITIHELLCGGHKTHALMNFIHSLEVLPFDCDTAIKSAEVQELLMSRGQMIGKLDILIAASSIIHHVPLLTTDNDFSKIPHLKLIFIK